MLKTKRQAKDGIWEYSTWIAAGIIGAGVAMSLTVVLIPLGMRLVALGAVVAVLGWLTAWLLPLFFHYQTIYCPYCKEVNQVRRGVVNFNCGGCGRKLPGDGYWRQGRQGLKVRKARHRVA